MDDLQNLPGQEKASEEFRANLEQLAPMAKQVAAELPAAPVMEPPSQVANQAPDLPVQPGQETTPPSGPEVFKVGDEEISSDQLVDLVKKGKMVTDWEAQRPGYKFDSLSKEFTRKSQELAELKRRQSDLALSGSPSPEVPLPAEEQVILQQAVTPIINKALQKVLQEEKDNQALDHFKKTHPEYNNSEKWNDFANFFNRYYTRLEEVTDQVKGFELAHKALNFEIEVQKKALETKGQALANQQKLEMASVGGGSQKTPPNPHESLTQEQLYYMQRFGVL